eukprot:12237767-Heterocapsa_arctica.AAC.1
MSTMTQSGNTGNIESGQSDKESVHRNMTAEDIDFRKRDSEKDPRKLGMDKKRKGGDTYSCEQQRTKQKHRHKAQNYSKWKFKKRKKQYLNDLKRNCYQNTYWETRKETNIMTHDHNLDTGK